MRTLLTTLHSKFIHPSLALPYLAAYSGVECGELLIREFTVHEPKENILAALLAEEQVLAYRYAGTRYDCGSKLGYLQATVVFGRRHPEVGAGFTNYLKDLD